MSLRMGSELRRRVFERATGFCEYCRLHESWGAGAHQMDHVVAEKHGGPTTFENLALSCVTCNLRKGSDVASFDPDTGDLVRLFNPRSQVWSEHFALDEERLVGLTAVGRTSIEFLQLNSFERLVERAEFIRANVYPPNTH